MRRSIPYIVFDARRPRIRLTCKLHMRNRENFRIEGHGLISKQVDLSPSTYNNAAMKTYPAAKFVRFTPILLLAICALSARSQQAPALQSGEPSPLAPPINHESGTIDEVLTAEDGGYRMRGYVVNWRSARVFVSGAPAEPRQPGASLDLTVYRSSVNGQHSLRFAITQLGDDASVAEDEGRNSQVSITSGTAKVEDVLQADSDGYRFLAYLVSWHDRRVAVVDPLLHGTHAVGDQIDFRVFHTGASENRQLSFAVSD